MKKIMKRRTALIIGIIFIILVFGAVYWYFENKYQKYYEDVPELSLVLDDGTEVPMLCYQYSWEYKGNTSEDNLGISVESYDFSDEYTAFCDVVDDVTEMRYISLKNNIKSARTSVIKYNIYTVTAEEGSTIATSGIADSNQNSRLYVGDYEIDTVTNVGEYIYDVYINYNNQGWANYAIRLVAFDKDLVEVAKGYMNTSIDDEETIQELVAKLDYSDYLLDVSVDGTNLNLNYEYYILENSTKMNNLCLFACIPELETITYTGENANTYEVDSETGELILKEKTAAVFTREDVNSENAANTENLIKYMESL